MIWHHTRLTKAQKREQEIIQAWFESKPLKMSSRDKKPSVPVLSLEKVLEMYVPPSVQDSGQFFTPVETAMEAFRHVIIQNEMKVADFCAGIGNLFYPFRDDIEYGENEFFAFEIEQSCVEMGRRLFPKVRWNWAIPFDAWQDLQNKFDLVLMNAPFGSVMRGMTPAHAMSQGKAKKAEHLFLELAVRSLRPGGQAVIIAPYNFMDMPKPFRAWVDERMRLEDKSDVLPGKFKMTSVRVHAYDFTRLDDPKPVVEPIPRRLPDFALPQIEKGLPLQPRLI